MKVNGKERGFKLTVGASSKIAEICPGKDIKNIGELFNSSNTAQMINIIAFVCSALSEGYEISKKFSTPGYEPDVLSQEEIFSLGISELSTLQDEMMSTIERDMNQEVITEPVPAKGKKTRKKASQ